MSVGMKPWAITYSELFSYDVRAEALRLLGSGISIGVALDDTLAHPKRREILLCLAHRAFGGITDYYRGDDEAASWCVSREHMMCSELESLEADLIHDGRTTLKFTRSDPVQVELAAARAEYSRILADTAELHAQAQAQRPAQLVPGVPISLRGLALLRAREREEW
jgi:hypothetical protein